MSDESANVEDPAIDAPQPDAPQPDEPQAHAPVIDAPQPDSPQPEDLTAAPEVPAELLPEVPDDEEPAKPANPLLAIVVGVLAVALVASAGYFGFRALSGGGSDSRAQVTTSLTFTQAMLSQDSTGLKRLIPADSVKKVTDAQWTALDKSATKPSIAFQKIVWSGDTATLKMSASGQSGQVTAISDPRAADTVTLSFSGPAFGSTVPGSCVLVREGSGWKVTAYRIDTTTLKFDAANIANTLGAQ
jgi:hypothetical protein